VGKTLNASGFEWDKIRMGFDLSGANSNATGFEWDRNRKEDRN